MFQKKRVFDFEIKPMFLSVEELISKAQKVTDSCYLREQVFVSSAFFKRVVNRGLVVQEYSEEEAVRLFHIVDYMATNKLTRLIKADFVDSL
jgi:hypothetical protein